MFNKKILYLFLIVSIFIFIAACDNFNNKPADETSTNALVIITTSKIEETSLVTIQPTMTPTVKPTSTLSPTNSNTITPIKNTIKQAKNFINYLFLSIILKIIYPIMDIAKIIYQIIYFYSFLKQKKIRVTLLSNFRTTNSTKH